MPTVWIVACAAAAVLASPCATAAADPHAGADGAVADALSPADMSGIVERSPYFRSSGGTRTDDRTVEGRGKKPKPGQMAMTMIASTAFSVLIMKALTAIKLFIIHSFFATKLSLLVGAYLLLCKLLEMKHAPPPPPKKVIKWIPPPVHHHDEHHSPLATSAVGQYPEVQYEQQQQQQPYQVVSGQYGAPQPQQQFMPSGDFNSASGDGGSDLQAHYSYVSPVTYKPMISRNQSDNLAKSTVVGRIQ